MLLPFQGATAPTRGTQGVASLALGYVLHWAFSPPLLNPPPGCRFACPGAMCSIGPLLTSSATAQQFKQA